MKSKSASFVIGPLNPIRVVVHSKNWINEYKCGLLVVENKKMCQPFTKVLRKENNLKERCFVNFWCREGCIMWHASWPNWLHSCIRQ